MPFLAAQLKPLMANASKCEIHHLLVRPVEKPDESATRAAPASRFSDIEALR
jgi:hypothetical protein